MSVTCPHCGAKLEGRFTRCPECGERIPRFRGPNDAPAKSFGSRDKSDARSARQSPAAARQTSAPARQTSASRATAQRAASSSLTTTTSQGYEDNLMGRFQPNAAVPLKAANRPAHPRPSKRHRRESYLGVFLGILVTALLVGVVVMGVRTRGFGVFAEFEDRPSNLPGAPEAPVDEIAQLDKPLSTNTTTTEEAPGRTFLVEAKGSLTEYGWDELAVIAAEIETAASRADGIDIASHYNLVLPEGTPLEAVKQVEFSEGVMVPVRVADILHDDKADGTGKAGITFICAELPFVRALRTSDTNAGGWEASELRAWLNNELLNTVEEDLRGFIVPVFKTTNNVGPNLDSTTVTNTEDWLWIPSAVEVGGKVSYQWTDAANKQSYDAVINAEGVQYAVFNGLVENNVAANPGIELTYKGDSTGWWLRSPSPSVSNHYRNVDNLGDPSWYEAPTKELGICIGFCL